MRYGGISFSAFLFIGCATYSQVMVNPAGQTIVCQAQGSGLVGSASARDIQDRCQASLRAAGYIEIERAGAIGILLSDSLEVVRVVAGSPADSMGVHHGDRLRTIDGQPVHDRSIVQSLLFGLAGSPVTLRLAHGTDLLDITIVRKPYPAVYGSSAPR